MQIDTVKVKLLLLLPVFLFFTTDWHHNLSQAQIITWKDHKYILLNFRRLDWWMVLFLPRCLFLRMLD